MHRDSRLAFEEQSFNLVFKNAQTHDYQNIKCLEQLNQGLLIIFSHQNHTPSLVFKVGGESISKWNNGRGSKEHNEVKLKVQKSSWLLSDELIFSIQK